MTENKGDLISREALKKAIEPYRYATDGIFEGISLIIDNAPTVEVIPTELHEKIMDKTTGELLECQSNLRTQGEWKLHGMIYYCSVCGHECGESGDNFCGNCGADMRPKPNQLRDCENCIHHSDNGCEVWECEFEKRSDV